MSAFGNTRRDFLKEMGLGETEVLVAGGGSIHFCDTHSALCWQEYGKLYGDGARSGACRCYGGAERLRAARVERERIAGRFAGGRCRFGQRRRITAVDWQENPFEGFGGGHVLRGVCIA
jgi:hypothetical protein